MPKREDEFWSTKKDEELRYCSKHKRHYRADLGCQLCILESEEIANDTQIIHEDIELVKCPFCREKSLFWVEQTQVYECMNSRCKAVYTTEQFIEAKKSKKTKPLGRAWFGNQFFDIKKKKWRKP